MQDAPPPPRWTRPLVWSLGLVGAVVGLAELLPLEDSTPALSAPRPDLAPLYLGGWALWHGLDPTSPAVHAAEWARVGAGTPPGAWFMPYPASAALLAMPLCYVGWQALAEPMWVASVTTLALGAVCAGLGRPGGLRERLAGAGLALMAVMGLEVTPHALNIGQINPIVVGLVLAAAAALARGWERGGGLLLALGAALKLFPGVLLLPLLLARRWRALAWAAGGGGLLALATWSQWAGWSPLADLGRAWEQVTVGQAHVHPPLGGYWHLRGAVAGALSAALGLWLVRRRRDARAVDALLGLALALGAVEAGGLSPPHEVLLVAPALAWLAGSAAPDGARPRALALALGAALLSWSPLDHYPAGPQGRMSQDHAMGLIVVVWALAAARVLAAGQRQAPRVAADPIAP